MFVKSVKISNKLSAVSFQLSTPSLHPSHQGRDIPSPLVGEGAGEGDLGGLKNPASCILHHAFFVLLLLAFLLLPSLSFATMENYCLVPPYVKRDVSVNIMILMDNSVDMLAPAYKNTTYCSTNPSSISCYDTTNNRYYDKYMGHFPQNDCYNPNVGGKFKYQRQVNFTADPNTGCPAGEYNGNILNWITMSQYTIAKKVLTGEASTSAAQPFEIEGNAALSPWPNKDYAGCRATVSSSATNVLSITVTDKEVAGACKYSKGGPWVVRIDPTTGIEVRTGILQEFTDVNPKDSNFDKGSPRFGITIFSSTGVTISISIPPVSYESFINSVKTMGTRANNDLATAHYKDDEYFKSPANVNEDPYKGCASWETPPCVQGAAVPCRKSAILMLTTGTDVSGTNYATLPAQCLAGETRPLVRNACYAYNTDLRTDADLPAKQNLETYVIQTFGTAAGGPVEATTLEQCASASGNTKVLCEASVYGGGTYYSAGTDNLADTIRKALQDIIKRAAAGTAASVLASGEGSGANLIQAVFYPRAMTIPKGGIFGAEIDWIGRLVNYWYYVDPFFAASSIYEDNASNKKLNLTDDNKIELYFDASSERTKARRYEDANDDGVPETLKTPDIEFEKLSSIWEAGVELWKRDIAVAANKRKIYTTVNGSSLLTGNFSQDTNNGDSDNTTTLMPYFALPTTDSDLNGYADGDLDRDGDVDNDDAGILIGYIQGEDVEDVYPYLRSRTTAVNLNPLDDNDTSDAGEAAKVWKLGDVLNSTPKISSWIPLNTYHQKYEHLGETSYENFINTSGYKSRGMVFAGANDGMLHAFKLGTLDVPRSGYEKAALCDDTSGDGLCSGDEITATTDLGKEAWAFIPKNALPYLKYLTDPGYCHIYSIDLTPYIFDASIGTTDCTEGNYADCLKTGVANPADRWRTILIGGMRYGGACRGTTASCNGGTSDCVKTPVDVDGQSIGFSSYFALDITDQNNPPTLLWEFSNPQLGFTTTGPAVVRVSAKDGVIPNNYKNGHWFVVFGSGPTGPISTTDQQFLGRSDQNLRLFVLDLKTGSLLRTIDTTIPTAFAGSMLNTTIDPDSNYQDDVVYIPYVKKAGDGTWTQGGIGRLVTSEHIDPTDLTKWKWSTVIDNIGPVTSSVANLINKSRGQLWLYFGTGRYYFEQGVNTDDATGQRQIFGIKEPCYSSAAGFMPACTTSRSFCTTPCSNPTTSPPCTLPLDCDGIKNVTDIANVPSDPTAAGYYGWYINLDPAANPNDPDAVPNCSGGGTTSCTGGKYGYCEGNPATIVCRDYRAERIITDPLTTTTGLAFFTAYKPYKDECTFGGKSFIWATKYDTGGAPGALVKGIALVQVSTGAIEQIDLSKAFTLAGKRKSGALEGVPPTAQGLSLVSTPPPVKKVLHIRER